MLLKILTILKSKNEETIYVSDWKTSSIIAINKDGAEKTIYTRKGMTPADIALIDNKLFIPDMQNHNIIVLNLKNLEERLIELQ